MAKKPGGSNEPHMRYVQGARQSNEAGFHGKSKKQESRASRRLSKKELRELTENR